MVVHGMNLTGKQGFKIKKQLRNELSSRKAIFKELRATIEHLTT